MSKQRLIRLVRIVAPFLLATAACTMVPFFGDPNPFVAGTALVAWGLFVAAIFKIRRPSC
jgi:hypothetical protein